VVVVVGDTPTLPAAGSEPSPEMLTLVAPVTDQESVLEPPIRMEAGFAVKVTTGKVGGGVEVTVTVRC
jgi:hypothetical protein